jgi:putative heme iron utilization protein
MRDDARPPATDPFREADDAARELARRLLANAPHGALAVLDPLDGHPLASRVAIALDADGAPLLLLSSLSAHTAALAADPRCTLLVGEPGAGDPLAHPRLALTGHAVRLDRATPAHAHARARWLERHPEAGVYVDFGDFGFWRLELQRGLLNGGFARAYRLGAADLRTA